MLATTAYDCPDASYTYSIASSREAMTAAGIQSAYVLLSGNCHVDDARNSVVHEFLQSDCTDLVFLDADVSWDDGDLVALCQYDLDLVGGVYCYRREDVRAKGGMPYRFLPGAKPKDGLLEVEGLPTGFMRLRRVVIETLAEQSRTFDSAKDRRDGVPLIFERTLEDGTRWGGDLNMCNKWRATGGKIYAATEMRLGHVCKTVLVDSLAANLRRASGQTLRHVADCIRSGTEEPGLYTEAMEFVDNPWGADEEVLMLSVGIARQADGPIIEAGSGLTTVLMAAATKETVFCIEHDPVFAGRLKALSASAGVTNIAIVRCDIKDGWYDISEDADSLPESFALGLNDGPPRQLGDRMRFFDVFGARCKIILADDADDPDYAKKISKWGKSKGRAVKFPDLRAAIISGDIENATQEKAKQTDRA